MRYYLLFLSFIVALAVPAQKPVIDTSTLGKWPGINLSRLSNDGKYFMCSIQRSGKATQVVVGSVNSNWRKIFPGSSDIMFSSNKDFAIVKASNDSLFLLRLGADQQEYIGKVSSYALLKDSKKNEWLVYQEKDGDKRFIVRELNTGRSKTETNVLWYSFNEASDLLILQKQDKPQPDEQQSLTIWNLLTGDKKIIWRGVGVNDYVFDTPGHQIAFIADSASSHAIWYFTSGMNKAEKWVSQATPGIDTNMLISNEILTFSKDGTNLFFQLIPKPAEKADPELSKVDIWNYKDAYLQENQLSKLRRPRTYTAVLRTDDKTVHMIERPNEALYDDVKFENSNKYVILTTNGSNIDLWWNPTVRSSVFLESLKDGSRTLIKEGISFCHNFSGAGEFSLSPDEKFVIYFDPIENNYFSYEIATHITRNITAGLNARWRNSDTQESDIISIPEGIAGWVEKDAAILIYDVFDIWQVDPLGKQKPINITDHYGLAHHTVLRLCGDRDSRKPIMPGDNLLLNAFDTVSKYRGFYSMKALKPGHLTELTMGPYVYSDPDKAGNSDTWLLRRESAKEAPNLFLTKDLKNFVAISDVQPQQRFNWLTSELVTWTLPNGSKSQGILYKPEDFDPSRKYPLLIHYYEERSYELYQFKTPELTFDFINIPWFVSRGYLVFVPDIHYDAGNPGESVLNTILSGARCLCQNAWIDSTKIGLQGHSFGGWETNYLVTHTNMFAAAAEGSGVSDLISAYGGLNAAGSGQFYYELIQGRMRSSLWDNPENFLSNSPVFQADHVTTPLLMMHNKRDNLVPWTQGIEFFTALRRLGKRAWMLQYDEGAHMVRDDKDPLDYTIRMTQFFDHYLKGAPPPKWMTEGISAKLKGIETGYELDASGKEPEEQKVLYKGKIQLVKEAVKN